MGLTFSAAQADESENGAEAIIANKLRHGDANTIMAQGGIQAADKPGDSPAIHYLDVVGGGHFANHPDLVEVKVAVERVGGLAPAIRTPGKGVPPGPVPLRIPGCRGPTVCRPGWSPTWRA